MQCSVHGAMLKIIFFPLSHPGYFGKVGMRHIHYKKNQFYCPVINVDQLWKLMGDRMRERAKRFPGIAPVLNCVEKVYEIIPVIFY